MVAFAVAQASCNSALFAATVPHGTGIALVAQTPLRRIGCPQADEADRVAYPRLTIHGLGVS
jgi:hypothetical protein